MRMAGIVAQDHSRVEKFLGLLRATLDDQQLQRARTIVQPSLNPKAGVIIIEGCNPGIQCASLPDGSFAILDGEVYNDNDLPAGTVSQNSGDASDAARLLKKYLLTGEDAIARLNAAAIAVIWDANRSTLLFSRDRYGTVAGYYMDRPGELIWSSDVETLMRVGISCSIDHESIDFFLAAGYVPAPWTPIKQIRKIPPGHALLCRDGGSVQVEPYWRPTGQTKLQLSTSEATERLRELLKISMHRRYGPQGRTGVLLSGGVDSTLLVAGYTKLLGVPVDTFTFRYADYEGPFNELLPARRTAEYFGTRHHEIRVSPSDVEAGLESMVCAYGEPFSYPYIARCAQWLGCGRKRCD